MNDAQMAIFVKLKAVMASVLKIDLTEVDGIATPQSLLRNDLGIDSVESLDFLAAIETLFSISISDQEAPELKTVQDVIDTIIRKQAV